MTFKAAEKFAHQFRMKIKIHPGHIGFDIDGVVADTMEAFIRLADEDYGINTIKPEDITCYMVEECLDVDPVMVDEIFGRLLDKPVHSGLQPMRGAVPVLKEIALLSPLTFVTARPQGLPIAHWLKTFLGEDVFEASRLIAMGEHDGKAEYIKDMGLQYFIDDRLQTCHLLEQEGITPIVYNQPWNDAKHGFMVVENWDDIRDICLV